MKTACESRLVDQPRTIKNVVYRIAPDYTRYFIYIARQGISRRQGGTRYAIRTGAQIDGISE